MKTWQSFSLDDWASFTELEWYGLKIAEQIEVWEAVASAGFAPTARTKHFSPEAMTTMEAME